MHYNETLADRIRAALADVKNVEEKNMMGGLTFMVNKKMCLGILKDDLMVRLGPDAYDAALEKRGCREMTFTGRPMKGFVFVDQDGTKGKKELDHWVSLALDFNKYAKATKKKKTPAKKATKKK